MPSPSLRALLSEAPRGVLDNLSKEELASLLAGLLALWQTLYPNDSLVVAVKRIWRDRTTTG